MKIGWVLGTKSPHLFFTFGKKTVTHRKRMTSYEPTCFVNSLSVVETYQLTHFLIPFIVNITSEFFFSRNGYLLQLASCTTDGGAASSDPLTSARGSAFVICYPVGGIAAVSIDFSYF